MHNCIFQSEPPAICHQCNVSYSVAQKGSLVLRGIIYLSVCLSSVIFFKFSACFVMGYWLRKILERVLSIFPSDDPRGHSARMSPQPTKAFGPERPNSQGVSARLSPSPGLRGAPFTHQTCHRFPRFLIDMFHSFISI